MPSIVRYNPWSMLRGIQDDMNTLFNQNLSEKGMTQWSPHVDVEEEKDKYRIIADLPGVKPNEIKVHVDNNLMTIEGERKSESKKEKEGYSRIERFSGSFYRQFSLPENVDTKNIQAKTKNGVLEVTIPKKEASTTKTIDIKVNEE